jgi:hypothetical protein
VKKLSVNVMNESNPSTYFIGDGPQISVCVISKIPTLCLASSFLTCATDLHINRLLITVSNIRHREEEMTTMASKDGNKRKYSADGTEEEAGEASPKK